MMLEYARVHGGVRSGTDDGVAIAAGAAVGPIGACFRQGPDRIRSSARWQVIVDGA
jgi:hypothetical protein